MHANSRIPCVDALKAIACLMIVTHHLAFYGPMSDVAYPLMPSLIDWLYQDARLAVQVFFVTAGFLFAGKFAPQGITLPFNPLHLIKRRYLRLAMPYIFALAAAVACAALVRGTLTHDGVPDLPNLPQVLANVFLLQDLLDENALSAGVWYVAIDFQLFAFGALLLWVCGSPARKYPGLAPLAPLAIVMLTAVSLLVYNRNDSWDDTALYFFGAYGLGILAYWGTRQKLGLLWLALLAALVAVALLIEFRSRIAVAGTVMLMLGLARQYPTLGTRPVPRVLSWLGRRSYSVFLIHYPLCLLVNAVFFIYFPHSAVMNAIGMVTGVTVSVAGGALFFKCIESGLLMNSVAAAWRKWTGRTAIANALERIWAFR